MTLKRACYATLLAGVYLLGAGCSPDAQPTNAAMEVSSAPAETETQADSKLVLAFGDSLYAGYGLAPNESFPAQLEQALRKGGAAAQVRNAGVSGDTSATGLERLGFTLAGLPRKPDLAIVGLGANDMLRGLDPAVTKQNLLAICRRLREDGIPVVLTGMVAAPNLGQDYGRRYNAIFPEVATDCGATLDPFFLEGVITNPKLMLEDRIHPNSDGIAKIVSRVRPVIAQELKRSDRKA